jgi:hypothetical protein
MSGGQAHQAAARTRAPLAAEQLLAGTAEQINPGTPAGELLSCVQRYRAHLAALAAACRGPGMPAAHSMREEP